MATPDPRTASSPSPSFASTPAGTSDEVESVRQEYAAFRAKATQWKHAVKAQLEEAAAKNATLRNELKEAHSRAEQLAAETRLQLTNEFKERTALKSQECEELALKVAQLQHQMIEATAAAKQELVNALSRQREELTVEHQVALQQAEKLHEEAARVAEVKLRKVESAQEKLAQENAILSAKVRQLTTALDEERAGAAAAASSSEASSATAVNARHTTAELEKATGLISDLQREVSKLRSEVDDAHREKTSEIQRVEQARENEVLRRSEQLLVLQTLLKQSHQDNSSYQQKLDQLAAANRTLEHSAHEKIAALSQDLVAKMTQLDEANGRLSMLEANLGRALQQVRSLEEEAACRERAFSDLMLSDDSKNLVALATLERDNAIAALEAAEARNAELVAMVDTAERAAASQSELLEQRETEIQRRSAEADAKLERLRQEGHRIREMQVQLSAQAQQLASILPQSSVEGGSVAVGAGITAASSSGDNSSSRAVDLAALLSWTNVRHHYFAALRQGGGSRRAAAAILFHTYRRILPVLIAVLLLCTVMYWWAFSGTTSSASGDKSLRRYADMVEELGAMKREYGVVAQRLAQCCNITVDPVSLTVSMKKI